MAKKDAITDKLTTPKGELTGFICLEEPSTKFDKDGVYSTNILLNAKEGKAIADKILEIRTKQYKTYGKGTKVAELTACVPYTTQDEETGEDIPDTEGRYILKTKGKAFIKDGKPTVKIALFDAKGNKISGVHIGAGTIARLSLVLSGYSVAGKTGVSVKLKAVQIIDLVEFGVGDAASYGFDEEEGFEGDETTEETTTTTTEDTEEEDF